MSVHPIFLPILKVPILKAIEHKPRNQDEEFPFFDEEATIALDENQYKAWMNRGDR